MPKVCEPTTRAMYEAVRPIAAVWDAFGGGFCFVFSGLLTSGRLQGCTSGLYTCRAVAMQPLHVCVGAELAVGPLEGGSES